MKVIISLISFVLLIRTVQPTVFVTHGLGTDGIKYYQNSVYIELVKESAKSLGHEVLCIPWLDQDSSEKSYAGILPQERIYGAVKIAKEILNEIKRGKQIILIGHGYGGQVMSCATRLLNPENTKLTDSFIYELIYLIKNSREASSPHALSSGKSSDFNQSLTRTIDAEIFLKTLIWGYKISKNVFDVIAASNIVNSNLIKLIKQKISLEFIEETKLAWVDAFRQVQDYKNKLFKCDIFDHKNSVQTIYTIGTAYNGDMAFCPDMQVVRNHVNFYSTADSVTTLSGLSISSKKLTSKHLRAVNIEVLFEQTKDFAPKHNQFCGNVLMAPWIFKIPQELKIKNIGKFEKFEWGKSGVITFYTDMVPVFEKDDI